MEKKDYLFINFDETALYFDLLPDYTYKIRGEVDINLLSHRGSSQRITLMPTICSNGFCLPPLFVGAYKYMQKSEREFPKKYEKYKNLTRPYVVRFSETGFSTEDIIIDYISKVIIPYTETLQKPACLIIDQAPSHTSHKVQSYLKDNKIKFVEIPAGATYLL